MNKLYVSNAVKTKNKSHHKRLHGKTSNVKLREKKKRKRKYLFSKKCRTEHVNTDELMQNRVHRQSIYRALLSARGERYTPDK